ncbi:MAG: PD40 domain-containing protein [Planctomycetes bacterium]|nr:PD40 domain-containing protein [Planctomycetota bacterium]
MANLFNYIRIVIIILFILITGYPDNVAVQGQTLDIGEEHTISSQKSDGIYIPLNTAFTDVRRTVLKVPSPDHKTIYSIDRRIVASAPKTEPEKIMLWNTVTGASLDIRPAELIKAWGLFPDGKILATGGEKNITLWDTATGSLLKVLKGFTLGYPFALSPDGKMLATVNNKKVIIRNVDTGNIIKELKGIPAKTDLQFLSFSIDGRILVLQNSYSSVIIWNTATWNKIEFKNINDDVVFSPDGRLFGIRILFLKEGESHWRSVVYFFNAKTLSKVATITSRDVSFSSDGKILAATDTGESVTLWDTATWHRIRTFATAPDNCGEIFHIAFSPDNRTIVTDYWGEFIILWDSVSGNRIKVLAPERYGYSYIGNIFFSPDGRKLFNYRDESAPPPPPPSPSPPPLRRAVRPRGPRHHARPRRHQR